MTDEEREVVLACLPPLLPRKDCGSTKGWNRAVLACNKRLLGVLYPEMHEIGNCEIVVLTKRGVCAG